MEFRTDINGLRAVAVVAVLLYHFAVPGFGGGFVGVDIFYVLSGYLMTGILQSKLSGAVKATKVIAEFYLARSRRIVPALLGLCMAVLVLGWFWVAPSHYVDLAGHAAASLGFFSNIVYWQQVNYFNPDAAGFWFLHTWSLSVEWQFYLVYPLFLLLAARLAGGANQRRLRIILLLTLAGSFAMAVAAAVRAPQAAFYLLPPRAWELLAGGAVCLYQDHIKADTWMRRALMAAGMILILIPIVVFDDQNAWATLLVAAPVMGTSLVLLVRQPNPLLDNPLSQRLGLWSYSIYLWHWPIAVLFREADATGPTAISIGLALSLLAGYASFRLIETPARKGLTRRNASGQVLWQLAVAGSIAVFALTVIHTDGFRQRTPVTQAARYRQMEADRQQWDFPTSCSALSHQGTPHVCSTGPEDAARRVLVLGDSHAQQWYPWFDYWAQQRGVRVDFVTYEGCPVGYLSRPGLDCAGFWTKVGPLTTERSPQQILLFSNWQVPGIDDAMNVSNDAGLRARIEVQLTQLLPALRAHGAEITLVGALPRIDRHLPDEITSRIFRGSTIDALRTMDCAHFHALAIRVNDGLQHLAATFGARFVDPLPAFCDRDQLQIVSDDGRLLFRDGNHVSSIGALRYGTRVLGSWLAEP